MFAGSLLILFLLTAAPQTSPLASRGTARFPKGLAPMALGAVPKGLHGWSTKECASCHAREARDWMLSGHASARTNFVFQAALQIESPTWCVQCHAPLSPRVSRAPVPAEAPAEHRGVPCAACHAGAGTVLGAHPSPDAPHPVEVSPLLHSSLLCAQCHQFGFAVNRDGRLHHLAGGPPQQDTYGEWLAWKAESHRPERCQDCHMPDHTFGGVRRVGALRHSVRVSPTEDGSALEIWLDGVGHRLPTGDVMRALTLEVASDALFEDAVELASFGHRLGVRTWPGEAVPRTGLLENTSLAPGRSHAVRVPLPRSKAGHPWRVWRLVYHLVSPQQEREGLVPKTVSRITVATQRF